MHNFVTELLLPGSKQILGYDTVQERPFAVRQQIKLRYTRSRPQLAHTWWRFLHCVRIPFCLLIKLYTDQIPKCEYLNQFFLTQTWIMNCDLILDVLHKKVVPKDLFWDLIFSPTVSMPNLTCFLFFLRTDQDPNWAVRFVHSQMEYQLWPNL